MELKPESRPADTVHEQVIQSVAETRGVTPLDLPTPLFDVVDPDCLDRLVESGADDLRVTFEYYGCEVTVRGDGSVSATGAFAISDRR